MQRFGIFDKIIINMKKNVKKIFFVIPLFLAILLLMPLFSSNHYANASNYRGEYISISFENNEGKINWSLDFGLNTEARGLADDEEKATYRLRMQLMAQKILDGIKSQYQSKYDSAVSMAETEEEKLNLEQYNPYVYIKELKVPIYDYTTDSVGFTLEFSSPQIYYFYNGEEVEISKNIFLTTQRKEFVFPFAEIVQKDGESVTLAQFYREEYISACKGLSIENKMAQYDPTFIFDYTATANRTRTNADFVYTDAGNKIHYGWQETVNNINQDMIVSITLKTANQGVWYLLGAGICLLGMTIAIVIIVIKDKKGKNKMTKLEDNKTA